MSSAAAITAGWCGTLCATGGALRATGALSTATAVRLAVHLMAGLLLAPAAASMDQFTDYAARGDAFAAAAAALAGSRS